MKAKAYVCQCLMTAGVESMMVPSMSKRKPSKDTNSGELSGFDPIVYDCAVGNRGFCYEYFKCRNCRMKPDTGRIEVVWP